MSKRDLKYSSLKDAIADVERLKIGHSQAGNWSLPQASWHCGLAIHNFLKEVPAGTQSTPEQLEMQNTRLASVLAGNPIPTGLPTPPGTDPRADAPPALNEAEVDKFLSGLKRLDESQLKQINFGRFGVVSMDQFRKFILIHSAHHFSNFTPAS